MFRVVRVAPGEPRFGYAPELPVIAHHERHGTTGGVSGKKGKQLATPRVLPARPFLRPATDAARAFFERRMERALKQIAATAYREGQQRLEDTGGE